MERLPKHGARAPIISIIIPVRNSPDQLRQCLQSIQNSSYNEHEIIVVDDASTDATPQVALELGVVPFSFDRQYGPAEARNYGAKVSNGKYLFFIDADVLVHPDTISKVVQCFDEYPDVDAIFGSYDLYPRSFNIISQYKNLFHHFVHQEGKTEASTFWSGCGAIKRAVFLELGGFDTEFGRPCIEDIELGARLRKDGHRILLNKGLQVSHLKRWTLWSMFKTDVKDRGIPWTELILRERNLPKDLNLKLSQRMSAMFAFGIVLALLLEGLTRPVVLLVPVAVLSVLAALDNWSGRWRVPTFIRVLAVALVIAAIVYVFVMQMKWLILGLALLGAIVLINARFYAFFARTRGSLFAALVTHLHVFYYLYSGLSMILGTASYLWKRLTHERGKAQHAFRPQAEERVKEPTSETYEWARED